MYKGKFELKTGSGDYKVVGYEPVNSNKQKQ